MTRSTLEGAGRGRRAALYCIAFFALVLSACSFMPRDNFNAREQASAKIPGISEARFWADGSAAELRAFLKGSALDPSSGKAAGFDVLALSGGGYDGAFGAGIVTGWSAAGARPNFAVVTGVSAGALIAPLTFSVQAMIPNSGRPLQTAQRFSAIWAASSACWGRRKCAGLLSSAS